MACELSKLQRPQDPGMVRLLEENESNKRRQRDEDERQRLADLKAQNEYSRMLDKQEADRQNEMKRREARA